MIGRLLRLLVVVSSMFIVSREAAAHELDFATVSLKEVQSGRFLVSFHANSTALQEDLREPARFPEPCRLEGAHLGCGPSGLVGTIEFPWLEGTLTRVMVDIEWLDGARFVRLATASSPSVTVYGIAASAGLRELAPIAVDYTWLGVEHILTGFDHLLFVVALALLVRGGAPLLATVTAFTIAHSISLAATVLGLVSVPVPPVEASIALSIVLVCAECLRPHASLTRRAPWLVAFSFGLLHGLGFASALLDIGLPAEHVPFALFCFNIGVEVGQLATIGVVALVRRLGARFEIARPWLRRGTIYAMGGLAAFWCIDRVGAVLGY